MPFVDALRKRLSVLKEEYDSGLLPQSVYEELCRSSIAEYGNSAYETSTGQNDENGTSNVPNKKMKIFHHQDSSVIQDKRKNNKGQSNRRSYSKEEKLLIIALRDMGKSVDDIANSTGIAKSNVEKWVSDAMRSQIIEKSKLMLKTGLFSIDNISLTAEGQKEYLLDLVRDRAIAISNSADYNGDDKNADTSVLMMTLLQASQSAGSQYSINPTMSSSALTQQNGEKVLLNLVQPLNITAGHHDNSYSNSNSVSTTSSLRGLAQYATNRSASVVDPVVEESIVSDKVHKAAVTETSSQPRTSELLMKELLDAAVMYYDETTGSSSMDLPSHTRGVSVQNGNIVNAKLDWQMHPSLSHILTDSQIDLLAATRHVEQPVSYNKISEISMSFSSVMLDDPSDVSNMSMGMTYQAVRPVLSNTSYLTSYHENAERAASGENSPRSAKQIQDDEDEKVLSLLGEKKFFRSKK